MVAMDSKPSRVSDPRSCLSGRAASRVGRGAGGFLEITAAGGPRQVSAGAGTVRGAPAAVRVRSYDRFAWRASKTFSAVTGSVVTRTPTASCTALATAAAVGITAVSPMLMLP